MVIEFSTPRSRSSVTFLADHVREEIEELRHRLHTKMLESLTPMNEQAERTMPASQARTVRNLTGRAWDEVETTLKYVEQALANLPIAYRNANGPEEW